MGPVVWLYGLPCAGKTTLANQLRRNWGPPTPLVLDEEEARAGLCRDLGCSDEDESVAQRRIRDVAAIAQRQGMPVVVASITPSMLDRKAAKAALDCLMVHVSAPPTVCERRDVKGMWAEARAGLRPNFTGVEGRFDEDGRADDLVVNTPANRPGPCVQAIVEAMHRRWPEP